MHETGRSLGQGRLLLAGVPVAVFALVFGTSLAYFRLRDSDGSGDAPRAATSAGESGELPTVSGEGRLVLRLSAESDETAEGYLASVAVDGSDLHAITKPPPDGGLASDAAPAVSPDGETIAFQRATAGPSGPSEPRVYLVGLDGSGLHRLTRGPAVEINPAWSPDGTRIALARHVNGRFDLFVCAPDGSGLTQLTHTSAADEDMPAWSPDGTQIAFARYEKGFENSNGDLWVANADGTRETLLLEGPHDHSSPSWSPDGRRIAVTQDGHLAVMDADGTALRTLTNPGKVKETRPSWSPDGSRLVFTRDPGLILLVDPDGSHLARFPVDRPAADAVWAPLA
jgi:TolB protein